ncbi:MAG TPA: DUF2270 domain-containing protein [Vulgatibacter sp.]|nr:DUF2270 domain-containing protein [Vulgatibacter sp.]
MAGRTGRIASRRAPGMTETLIIHFYRAEVARSTQWRDRLDTTSNWAITATVAVISFSFTSRDAPHFTLLVGAGAVFMFLWIEARRYRYYDIWARRVALVEHGYLLPLSRREPVSIDFYAALAAEFSKPQLRISGLESLAFRLRRTYSFIFAGLLGAWVLKLDVDPVPAVTVVETLERARIGVIPAAVLWTVWLAMVLGFLWLMILGARLRLPPTELRAPTRPGRPPLADVFRGLPSERGLP